MLSNALMSPNPLKQIIIDQINRKGALSLHDYMNLCLYHDPYGFYMSGSPIGREGAFITAPEISQLFGEMIGIWIAQQWASLGFPSPIVLIELGPGRGTLMKDILRATKNLPGFHQTLRIHLVEISSSLKTLQASIPFSAIQRHATVEAALKASAPYPFLVIANEFFDALPLRQYEFTLQGWKERFVTQDQGKLIYTLMPCQNTALPSSLSIGSILESFPAHQKIIHCLSVALRERTGGCLIFDYGYRETQYKDTFQALFQHQYADPLDKCGLSDLTAHVNFEHLYEVMFQNGIHSTLTTQKNFLESMGIYLRASLLKRTATPSQCQDIDQSVHRLLTEMGTIFKVLQVIPSDLH